MEERSGPQRSEDTLRAAERSEALDLVEPESAVFPCGWSELVVRPGEVVWWLEDAELVAIWVGEDVPAPRILVVWLGREETRAGVDDAVNLGVQVSGPEVEVNAVLLGVGFWDALQEEFHPARLAGDEAEVPVGRGVWALVAEDFAPEGGGAFQVGAVEDDDECSVGVGLHRFTPARLVRGRSGSVIGSSRGPSSGRSRSRL